VVVDVGATDVMYDTLVTPIPWSCLLGQILLGGFTLVRYIVANIS
jgi:hypothetical protein